MQENVETQVRPENQGRTSSWTRNIVTDLDAPQFYSPRAIWAFSVIFSVIFGAVLFSSNLKDKKAKWMVVGFGIIYTAGVIIIMNQLPQPSTGLTIGLNGGGALILTNFFWGKYVGADTKFRTKKIWKPLIVSVLITIPFLLALIYG